MSKICNPIKIYFTPNSCKELSRYLKGNINVLRNNPSLALMLHSIYTHGKDKSPNMIYDGPMYRGISTNIPFTSIYNVHKMEWGSWSKSKDIAIDFASKSGGKYKYIIFRDGIAIDPEKIKKIVSTYFTGYFHYTGLDTYNPYREQEVIAPLIHSECKLIEI